MGTGNETISTSISKLSSGDWRLLASDTSKFKATSSPTIDTDVSNPDGVEFTISGNSGESIDGVDVFIISEANFSLSMISSSSLLLVFSSSFSG